MLQDVEGTALAGLRAAVERHDKAAFQQAYRQAMDACFACHQAAEKPYLRTHIPEQPSSRMIDFAPR
jgi:hypothetical protein